MGPTATAQQGINARLASCLYHCVTRLEQLESEYPKDVCILLKPNLEVIGSYYNVQVSD